MVRGWANWSCDFNEFVKILYFDQFLADWNGHCLNYARSLVGAATKAGVSFRVYSNTRTDEAIRSELKASPTFRYVPQSVLFEGFRRHAVLRLIPLRIPGFFHLLWTSFLCWRWLWQMSGDIEGGEALLFVPNWAEDVGPGLALGLRRFLARPSNRAVVLFRLPLRGGLATFSARLLKPLLKTGRFRLVTDSEGLARIYARQLGVDFEVLPIPHAEHKVTAVNSSLMEGRTVSFVWPGMISLEKGFDILVDALEVLGEELGRLPIRWEIQCYAHPFYLRAHPKAKEARERLLLLAGRHPSIVPLPEALSSEAYSDMIARSSLLLLTHRRKGYAERTSGGCVEALAMGKPMIATKGTWLAEQAERFGAALFYEDGDPQSLAATLRKAVAELPELTETARRGAILCREWHNPDRFLELLIGK